jgi:two-component system response regulator AtoC
MLSLALRKKYDTIFSTDAEKGLALLASETVDLVLLDLVIGETSGMEVLKKIKEIDPSIAIIMMTAFGSIQSSVQAIKNGAFTYLAKPLDMEELFVFVQQALDVKSLSEKVDYLSSELNGRSRLQGMVGESQRIKRVYELVEKLKDLETSVLITGESGTGKELVARAIHYSGKRKDHRFVVINCAAIPESLLEEELFGHTRGTFTGAFQDRKGKFEVADRGTIFLDEIGDLPLDLQGKLLRVLQQKEFSALGSAELKKVDVRILAATNKDLEKMVRDNRFREDLYYRLNVITIQLPPLRERKDDIPLLCDFFIKQFNQEQKKSIQGISAEAASLLMKYEFPGNVRQLANTIEHAMILASGSVIGPEDLPDSIYVGTPCGCEGMNKEEYFKNRLVTLTLKGLEKIAIETVLIANFGRRDKTASALGISVRNLQNKIKEYQLG